MKYAYVELELTGENKERFINLCMFHNISLWDMEVSHEKLYVSISTVDFFRLKKIIRKTGIHVRILEKKGLYFIFKNIKVKKIFYGFFLGCLLLLWLSSGFLWDIEIKGNEKIGTVILEEFLKEKGITYGMQLKKIFLEELEKEIRKNFFEITWTSVSLNGTTLVVHIKENDTVAGRESHTAFSHIVSGKKGVVDSILVRQGTGCVMVGDEVEEGTILIKGNVEIKNEDGTIGKRMLTEAKGDVWIRYQIPVNERILLEYDTKVYTGREEKEWEVRIKDHILSSKTKIPFLKYDYYENEITPPFFKKLFPDIGIYERNYRDYRIQREKYSLEEGEKILTQNFNKILKSLEEKGVQIIEKNVKIKDDNVSISLNGTLTVRELFKENDNQNE